MTEIILDSEAFIFGYDVEQSNVDAFLHSDSIQGFISGDVLCFVGGTDEGSESLYLDAFIAGEEAERDIGALNGDGSTGKVVRSGTNAFLGYEAFTLNVWFRGSKGYGYERNGYVLDSNAFKIKCPGSIGGSPVSGVITFALYVGSTVVEWSFNADNFVWYMGTIKYDGSEVYFYINGVQTYSAVPSGGNTGKPIVALSDSDPIRIGNAGQGSSVSDLKIWDYALNNSDIQDMYISPNRVSSHLAYIHIDDPQAVDNSVDCVLVSHIDAGNPGVAENAEMCFVVSGCIQEDELCYISAGVDVDVEWDTVISATNLTEVAFDTIVDVSAYPTGRFSIPGGEVLYPITRRIKKKVFVPSSIHPATIVQKQLAEVVIAGPAESNTSCYVSCASGFAEIKDLFIVGDVDYSSESVECFIVADYEYSSLDAFISSNDLLPISWEVEAYIEAPFFSEDGFVDSFISGQEHVESDLWAYISSQFGFEALQQAYIHSLAWDVVLDQMSYVVGSSSEDKNKSAYVFGAGNEMESVLAYISSVDSISSDIGAFIGATLVTGSTERAFVAGVEEDSSYVEAFIYSELNVSEDQDALISGYAVVRGNVKGFVSVEDPESLDSSVPMFIVNEEFMSGVVAYLHGAPMTYQLCYVRSEGVKSGSVDCWVNGGIS